VLAWCSGVERCSDGGKYASGVVGQPVQAMLAVQMLTVERRELSKTLGVCLAVGIRLILLEEAEGPFSCSHQRKMGFRCHLLDATTR
jgi:hypothetical protein